MVALKGAPDLVLGGDFADQAYSMFSAAGDAESHKYKPIVGKSGRRWLYNDTLFGASAHIYVEGLPGSRGFGGSTVSFPLLDGGKLDLKGPWHSIRDPHGSGALILAGLTQAELAGAGLADTET